MGLKLGNTDIGKLYLGSTETNKMYLGNNLIFNNLIEERPSLVESYNAVSTTLGVTVIATPTSGNYLVAQIALGNYSSNPTAPTGWTKLHETISGHGSHAFFAKESDGSETSITFSKTGGEGQIFMVSIYEFDNVSDIIPYRDLQGATRVENPNINIPSLSSTSNLSLAVSFVTALDVNALEDNIITSPSVYNVSSEYSSNLKQGAWNMLFTKECEDVVIPADNISFNKSAIHSTLNVVLNPTTAQNLYPYSNAAGNDTNTDNEWFWTSSISTAPVVSTDSILGDNYAIRLEARNDGLTTSSLSHSIIGLTQGVEYKAKIRCRASVTGGNTSLVFFNWNNVTNATYNGTVIGTDWEEVEIIFTPTNPTSITLKAYPFYDSGGSSLTGDFLEISSIIIEEYVAPELFDFYNAAADSNETETNAITGFSEVGQVTVLSESVDPQSGSYHITVRSLNSPSTTADRAQIDIPIEDGEQYEVKIWAREASGSDGRIQLFSGVSGWSTVVLTNTWTEYIQTVTATSTLMTMRFYPSGGSGNIGDEIYLDNISIKKVS